MNDMHPLQRLIRVVFDPAGMSEAPADAGDEQVAVPTTPTHLLEGHTLRDIFDMNAAECVDCVACMDSLCCLVETVLNGGQLDQILPSFAAHIEECGPCQEEYSALLSILQAELQGMTHLPLQASLPPQDSASPTARPPTTD